MQKGMILLVKMKNYIKQELEPPEDCINFPGFPLKDPLVSFLPDDIHRDAQGTLLIRASRLFFLRCNPRRALFKVIMLLLIRS
jgi:hypothetical protein